MSETAAGTAAGDQPELTRSFIAPGYEAVASEFGTILRQATGYSAQVAAYINGALVVDLAGGDQLAPSAITGPFSVTKGAAGLVIALLVQQGRLDLDQTVAHYWPEFAAAGKGAVLVRQMLSHQAGLVGVEGGLSTTDLADSRDAAARLAAMTPAWRPGAMFGYHGLTLGILMEELVRRVTEERLQDIFEREIRAPRGLDFYLGLPEELESRWAPVLPAPGEDSENALSDQPSEDSLAGLMFNISKPGETLVTSPASPNERAIRAAGAAAIGAAGTARGLAGVYAGAIGEVDGVPGLLDTETSDVVGQEQVWGRDRLLQTEMSFGIVFMKPQARIPFGSYRAFGHDGTSGALGFADPRYGMGFGYIPQPMQPPGGADPKGVRLAHQVRACAARLAKRR